MGATPTATAATTAPTATATTTTNNATIATTVTHCDYTKSERSTRCSFA